MKRTGPVSDAGDEIETIELLLAEAQKHRYRDHSEMVCLAELAAEAVARLDAGVHGPFVVSDLRAKVYAELGNAYRLTDALGLAERTFSKALDFFEEGSRASSLLLLIADRVASLFCHLRRLGDALGLLDRVYAVYEESGEYHLAGRALLNRGLYTLYAGDPHAAILITLEALDRLDRDRDPGLRLACVHNILLCEVELGHFEVVRHLLKEVRPLYGDSGLNLLRRRWVEGLVAAGLGEPAEAESALRESRAGFLEAGLVYPASMAALDLAELLLGQGRISEIKGLCEELIQAFRRLRVGREALLALILLRRACEQESVVLAEVESALRKAVARVSDLARRS